MAGQRVDVGTSQIVDRIYAGIRAIRSGPALGSEAAQNISRLQQAVGAGRVWLSQNSPSAFAPLVQAAVIAGQNALDRAGRRTRQARTEADARDQRRPSGGASAQLSRSSEDGEEEFMPVASGVFDAISRTLSGGFPAGRLSELWNPTGVPLIRKPIVQATLGLSALALGTVAVVSVVDEEEEQG